MRVILSLRLSLGPISETPAFPLDGPLVNIPATKPRAPNDPSYLRNDRTQVWVRLSGQPPPSSVCPARSREIRNDRKCQESLRQCHLDLQADGTAPSE